MNSARKSRLPVSNGRNSLLNSGQGRSRSVTFNRNTLSVQRSKSVTPGTAGSCSFQKSPLNRKDIRPLDNKKWQKEQAARVLAFIQRYEPSIQKLKPMTINLFTTIMHYLMTSLGEEFESVASNITTELPGVLKAFGYPTKLSPSTLKWPNTDHAFPAILGVMTFFLDLIEKADNYEEAFKFSAETEVVLAVTSKYFCAPDQGDLYTEIKKMMGEPSEEEKFTRQILETDIEHLQQKLAEKMDVYEETKAKAQKIHNQVLKIREENNSTKGQLKVLNQSEDEIQDVKVGLEQKKEKIEKNIVEQEKTLSNILPNFNIIIEENTEAKLEQQLTECRSTENMIKERLEANMGKINDLDFQLVQNKTGVETKVYKLNNILTELAYSDDCFAKFKIPEVGFSQESFIEYIDKLQPAVFNNTLDQLNVCFETMEKIKKEEFSKAKDEMHEVQERYLNVNTLYKEHNAAVEKNKVTIEQLERQIAELQIQLNELAISKIDMKKEEQLLEKARKRKEIMKKSLLELQMEAKEFTEKIKTSVDIINERLLKAMDNAKLVNHYKGSGLLEKTKQHLATLKVLKEKIKKNYE